jgi:hypothetical protein
LNIQERLIALEIKIRELENRIDDMEDSQRWGVRLLLGIVITSAFAIVFTQNGGVK